MYSRIEYHDDVDADVTLSKSFINDVIHKYKHKLEEEDLTCVEEKKKIESFTEELKKLTGSTIFQTIAYVEHIEIDLDDLPDDGENDYQNGYNDALEDINVKKAALYCTNSLLCSRLERLAYGFGKQEPLTIDDYKQLVDILRHAW